MPSLRSHLPAPLKPPLRRLRTTVRSAYRGATSQRRVLPDLIIIGAQKAGTTSLYRYLIANPAIVPPLSKEIHFFDLNYHRGVPWYRSHFPTHGQMERVADRWHVRPLTLEASPYYLLHPLVPDRLYSLLPNVKLVVLLRNPVDRAVSHYYHERRKQREHLPLLPALEREPERIAGELERIISLPSYDSTGYRRHSYLSRGLYAEQLSRWFAAFPREQFLILGSEALFSNPQEAVKRVTDFAGAPSHPLDSYRKVAQQDYPRLDPATSERLSGYFAPHNERLWALIGERFEWD